MAKQITNDTNEACLRGNHFGCARWTDHLWDGVEITNFCGCVCHISEWRKANPFNPDTK